MAGVKITDLTPLATAASDDLLYIVDVSDNTESPQGTSKQIEVGKMFSSGSYTPTISGEVNGIVVNVNAATFIRVGNVATCSAQLEIQLDTGETTGTFEISLPVASNLTSQKQCFGLIQYSFGSSPLSEIVSCSIGGEITNNTCIVGIEVATPSASLQYVAIQFQYEIL
jgi:hypothetical protein